MLFSFIFWYVKRNRKTILQINSSIALIFGIFLRFCGPKAKKKKKIPLNHNGNEWQRSFILLKHTKYFTHKEINSRRMMRSKLVLVWTSLTFGPGLCACVWIVSPVCKWHGLCCLPPRWENDLIDKTLYVIFQRTSIQATVSCVCRCSSQLINFNFNSVILFCIQYGNSHDSHKFKVIFRLYFFHI